MKKHREIEDKGRSSSSGDADDQEDEEGEGYENPSIGPSTAPFGDEDVEEDALEDSDDQDVSAENDSLDFAATTMPTDLLHGSPDGSESDGFVHVEYPSAHSPAAHLPDMMHDDFHSAQAGAFSFLPTEAALPESIRTSPLEVLTSQPEMLANQGLYSAFPTTDYFAMPQMSSYASGPHHAVEGASPMHASSPDSQAKLEHLSPGSLVESPQPGPDMRFKSPPPPADIASRRNMRRPAPLVGLGSLRAGAHGPKTGIELPRRADAASPMRRISSASSFGPARIQKSFSNPGPRSPFAFDRTKDALYQSLHTTQSPVLNTLNSAFSPLTPDTQGLRENTVSSNASDDEQGYAFGALGAPFYKSEQTIKTPPSTPGLRLNFQEHPFANPSDPWSYTTQDEPLPTPSLCSHGSEVDFSLAPQLPSYVASQPVTPSFPPSIGPAYNGFFGQSLPNAEYHFPDSFAPDSSVRMSPGQPTKAKQTQFQFAQNITPQDFNDK